MGMNQKILKSKTREEAAKISLIGHKGFEGGTVTRAHEYVILCNRVSAAELRIIYIYMCIKTPSP